MSVNPAYDNGQNGQYGMQPVTAQPGQHQQQQHVGGQVHARNLPQAPPGMEVMLMQKPQGLPGCPPGLEYLTQLDQLIIKQQVELLEVLTGFETQNKYRILNNQGQQAYFAKEESECCERQCCGPSRGFKMHITDNNNQEVITIERPFKCCAGCCWCASADCCSMELTIKDSQGQLLGHVKQRTSGWKPHYMLYDANMTELARMRGPCCICSCPCCGDIPFPVTDPSEKTQIGDVTKQWSGVLKEYFTDADTFSVSFPSDMDVRLKAVFIGAAFLIDFMYFEHSNNNNN